MKVVIIGASAAGLFAALRLAEGGSEVEVYERGGILGWPSRTLIVTEKLSELLGFMPEGAVVHRLHVVELFSRSRRVRLRLERPDLVVERARLVELLAERARRAGARIVLNHRFIAFADRGDGVWVDLRDRRGEVRRVHADVLIGADGALSAVARAAGWAEQRQVVVVQARVSLPRGSDPDAFQVWFDTSRTKYFYWLIPESDRVAAVGVIAERGREARVGLRAFLEERGLTPFEVQAARVPLYRFRSARAFVSPAPRVFLLGDAAAQVKVTTVGGVVTGIWGARALAEALLNGGNLRECLRPLRRELDRHLLLRGMLDRFTDADYDRLLTLLNERVASVLARRSRDEVTGMLYELVRAEPRLLILGIRALVRALW